MSSSVFSSTRDCLATYSYVIIHQCAPHVPGSCFRQWKRVVCLCLRFRQLFEEAAEPNQLNFWLHLLGSVEEKVDITPINRHSQLPISDWSAEKEVLFPPNHGHKTKKNWRSAYFLTLHFTLIFWRRCQSIASIPFNLFQGPPQILRRGG